MTPREQSLEAELERLRADRDRWQEMHRQAMAVMDETTARYETLTARWRADREDTERLVQRLGERLAAAEGSLSGRAH